MILLDCWQDVPFDRHAGCSQTRDGSVRYQAWRLSLLFFSLSLHHHISLSHTLTRVSLANRCHIQRGSSEPRFQSPPHKKNLFSLSWWQVLIVTSLPTTLMHICVHACVRACVCLRKRGPESEGKSDKHGMKTSNNYFIWKKSKWLTRAISTSFCCNLSSLELTCLHVSVLFELVYDSTTPGNLCN